jgi:hypothetical protein
MYKFTKDELEIVAKMSMGETCVDIIDDKVCIGHNGNYTHYRPWLFPFQFFALAELCEKLCIDINPFDYDVTPHEERVGSLIRAILEIKKNGVNYE